MGNEITAPEAKWQPRAETRAAFHPLQAAWERKSFVLIGLIVGLSLGGLYYVLATPLYESKAQVLVIKKRPDDVTGMDTRHLEVEDYVATQREIIRSQLVLERAIHKQRLASLTSFAGDESLTETFIANLQITRHKGASGYNNVLDLSLRAKDAEEGALALNAVIDSYKEFLDETYHNTSDSTLDLVKKARDQILRDLTDKEAAFREFQEKSPLIGNGKERNALWQDRLAGIEAKRTALLASRAEIQAQLTAIEEACKEGVSRETILVLIASPAGMAGGEGRQSTATPTLQERLTSLLAEEQKLSADYGPQHPQMQALRHEIERVRVFYASPAASWRSAAKPGAKEAAPVDAVEEHLTYLRHHLKHIHNADRLLTELYDREYRAAKKFAGYEALGETFRQDIARLNSLYDGIVKQLQSAQLVREVGGYEAKIINRPSPGRKVAPKSLLIFPAAALLGLLLGGALACVAAVTDKRFRSADEIGVRLGVPVLGYIPRLRGGEVVAPVRDKQPTLDSVLSSYHYSKSTAAEAYRAVRTALYFSSHGEGHRVLQITSAGAGEGKSTLAANLAISIAQSGKRVMLIDADLRKPQLHQLFGVAAEYGLSSIINGEVEAATAIQESSVPGLSILPCGSLPSNPAELLTSPRFEELLSLFRSQYDFVLVDTPPLLAVSDPSAVAARVDGVLLTVRLGKCTRPSAEHAQEMLRTLGAHLVGVVVNGAGRSSYHAQAAGRKAE